MRIAVMATDVQWKELNHASSGIEWHRVKACSDFMQNNHTDAFFSLQDDTVLPYFALLGKPVFINSVVHTLKELNAPDNILRINGWATFLQRPVWEIAGATDKNIEAIFESLVYIFVF